MIKRDEVFQHRRDNRIYCVIGAGRNKSHDDEATIGFKQVLNSDCEEDMEVGAYDLGDTTYFRTKEDFLALYKKVRFEKPKNKNWVAA